MPICKNSLSDEIKNFTKTAESVVSQNVEKATKFAKENAPKVKDFVKKSYNKANDISKKTAPVVKDFAKRVGEEIYDAGVQVKDFTTSAIHNYKNRNNVKVYNTKDVVDCEPIDVNDSDK